MLSQMYKSGKENLCFTDDKLHRDQCLFAIKEKLGVLQLVLKTLEVISICFYT